MHQLKIEKNYKKKKNIILYICNDHHQSCIVMSIYDIRIRYTITLTLFENLG